MRLLIGYDGSPSAEAAFDDLRFAGLPEEVEATVISVGELWLPPPSSLEILTTDVSFDTEHVLEDARALAHEALARLKIHFPGWEIRAEGRAGSPAGELLSLAEANRPDLIIVGSHGRTAIGRFFLGSVSLRVVQEAMCSVRVARGRIEVEPKPVRLLIGNDGSEAAAAAVDAVAARRWPAGSAARLATVIGPFLQSSANSISEVTTRAAALQAKEEEKLRSAGLTVSTTVEIGDPRRMLIEIAEQWGADCIFVGTRGLGQASRILLGSVAGAVVSRAHCSVEVVRKS
jgi:nucleotide-binding universal stress UspA family protein